MFGFSNNCKDPCPVAEDTRIWMENALLWLMTQFGERKIRNVKTLLPIEEDFPLLLNGTETMANGLLSIIAKQMDIDPGSITVSFYNEQLFEVRSNVGYTLYGQPYDDEIYSSGQYGGKDKNGKFTISIEVGQLKEPDKLVATLAHEVAHIKILGERRLQKNDEYLTDLATVFFGLGIFNANAAFRFYADTEKWSYSKQGYLTQQEWGYGLALYAYVRAEKNPVWANYLAPNIRSDFKKGERFISKNIDKVLV